MVFFFILKAMFEITFFIITIFFTDCCKNKVIKMIFNRVCFVFFVCFFSLPSQLGAMISTEPAVLEACGGLIPDPRDLKTLLLHQQAKGHLGVKGMVLNKGRKINK